MRLTLILMLVCASLCSAQTNTTLRDELLKMRETDQQAREKCAKGNAGEQIKCLVETLEKINQPNTARVNEIFNQSGFPTFQTVGKQGI